MATQQNSTDFFIVYKWTFIRILASTIFQFMLFDYFICNTPACAKRLKTPTVHGVTFPASEKNHRKEDFEPIRPCLSHFIFSNKLDLIHTTSLFNMVLKPII
jgi:hypothetical protein